MNSAKACLVILFIPSATTSFGDDQTWILRGRTVDQQGKPIADASVGTVWNANGITFPQLQKLLEDIKEHPEFTMNEGQMEPWGNAPTTTDADGDFSIEMPSPASYKAMALDKERKRGAVIIIDPHDRRAPVEAKLVPLVRVYGQVRMAGTGAKLNDVTVIAGLPFNEGFPLGNCRLVTVSSLKSRFEFWLPPGKYRLEVFGHDPPNPNLELTDLHPIQVSADQREFDCGVLDVVPGSKSPIEKSKDAGTWIEYTKSYGQPCPRWHVVDARGVSKDSQISDFRGKWVLVYFWGTGCAPCMYKTLPKLREFYETHQAQRNRFEIISICSDLDGKMQSMADLDRTLKPVVKAVWGGKELPFPVLLDNTYTSMERFGVDLFGIMLLVDPTGRLVKGDEMTLDARLNDSEPNKTP